MKRASAFLPVLWRIGLRLKFAIFQSHRHDREVIEKIRGLSILVRPGVFNPSLFRVSPIFLDWIAEGLIPEGSVVLDVGAGSGLLAIAAAAHAARVIGVDSNSSAVECARINARKNSVEDRVEIRLGDLFEPVAEEKFDVVLCNPPYFPGRPKTKLESAFYSDDFADRFAEGLSNHLNDEGRALVILSSIGDDSGFLSAFERENFGVEILRRRNLISEIITLYELQKPLVSGR